ncbi:MAG TPA: S41 family peptidase [Chitinophagaceae bacterium]|nr:S41 family peptidase [Chitinophagaceae bacterium]
MNVIKQRILPIALLGVLFFVACKKEAKDENAPTPNPTDTTAAVSASDRIKDTVLEFSREIYLWYKQIPATFNARSYADPDKIMTAIRQYSTEPGFSKPVDRWSFAAKQAEWDNISSGIAGDFGLNVFFRDASDLRVKLVEAASPAGVAGIRRGWRIVAINGSNNITTSNVDFIVDKVFNSSATTFTFEKPDGSTTNIDLAAATYQENPIVLDSVYNAGTKKIGYLSFNSFLGDTTQIYNGFQSVFSKFAAQQVTDMVVDLRYNGGGYVSVQEKLANYLVPGSANGNLMMNQVYNDNYAQWNSAINFKKLGTLNVSRIFFIVSQNTASASELLINNLKPYVDVQLVGPNKTYGKPVGFFPIAVSDWYIFPVSSRTTNRDGEGAYFNGLELNKKVPDGLDQDWGNLDESCLASVVNYIKTGAYLGQPRPTGFTENPVVAVGNEIIAKPAFKGTIENRKIRQ